MSSLLKNKSTLIGGAAVIILAGGYFFFFGGPSAPDATVSEVSGLPDGGSSGGQLSESAAATIMIEQELIDQLLNLKNITLDRTALDSEAYLSFQDFSRPIDPEPAGRPNPFAPYDAPATSTSSGGSSRLPF